VQRSCDKVRAVVRPDVFRFAVFQQQPIERVQNLCRSPLDAHGHTQGLAGLFVQHGEPLVASAIAQLVVDGVDAPDVAGDPGPQMNE